MNLYPRLAPLSLALTSLLSASAFATETQGPSQAGTDMLGTRAIVNDSQTLRSNEVHNGQTYNDASVVNSINGIAGSNTVNVAAGDTNQQASAGALASADALFVLGIPLNAVALADITVEQRASSNPLHNYGVENTANLLGSSNSSTGNTALNLVSGNFNQQKNDYAVAYSQKALSVTAKVKVVQSASNNHTHNAMPMTETDNSDLTASASGYQPRLMPTYNSAVMLDSLNNTAGSVGVNIAAGGGNQQSNALAISAGCTACLQALPQ
ncbi:MAG: hypothetical protein V4812_13375 [Pseudomonadota bacterium]